MQKLSVLGVGTMTQAGAMDLGEGLVKTDKLSAYVHTRLVD